LNGRACIDEALIERAQDVLKSFVERHLTLVTAESCTAGLISAVLSHAEGAGEALHGSFVTYSKANKAKALGVDEDLLNNRGAVNAEVVRQLALGALEHSPADVALAVSGVLGPSPDEDGNPVGLVYFCCCRRGGEPTIQRCDFGPRGEDALRRQVILEAMQLLEGEAHGVGGTEDDGKRSSGK
jgi:nicotinamide-nucleotide amidase